MLKREYRYVILILFLLLVIGCRQAEGAPAEIAEQIATTQPTMTATIQPSSTPSPAPTNTPTPTLTPSPTPTPTATAVSIEIESAIADAAETEPVPVGGAPCGRIDTLDFPIDPPLALTARGGQDFGVFRSRYSKYHAGEDWGAPAGRRNLGEPVYSIGHGRVMYAHANGWGRDKGVVIVEHMLLDGDIVYSFYGHLDPPSVILRSGECVLRGDQVGNIGDPRTPPHLHLEMRTHMPYQPGPGYWTEDPTTAGWIPPSQTIWNQRMLAQPNVNWIRPFTATIQPLGNLDATTFAFLKNRELVGMDVQTGEERLALVTQDGVLDALLLPETGTIYTINRQGILAKFEQSENQDAEDELPQESFSMQWEVELDKRGRSTLHQAPNNGVLVLIQETLFHLNADGDLLWQFDVAERPFAWANSDKQQFFATENTPAIWRIEGEELPKPIVDVTGFPVIVDDILWIHAAEGVYQLDVDEETAVSVYILPRAFSHQGNALPLADGGLLLAHIDIFDQRLMRFAADGSLWWERSFAMLFPNDVQLLMRDGQPHLATLKSTGFTTILDVYALDLETAVLTPIFTGGERSGFTSDSWIMPTYDGFMLSVNDGIVRLSTIDQVAQEIE